MSKKITLMRIGKVCCFFKNKILSFCLTRIFYFLQQLKSGLRQNFINKLLNHLKTYYEQKDYITTSEILENWLISSCYSVIANTLWLCFFVFVFSSILKVKCEILFLFLVIRQPKNQQKQQQTPTTTSSSNK